MFDKFGWKKNESILFIIGEEEENSFCLAVGFWFACLTEEFKIYRGSKVYCSTLRKKLHSIGIHPKIFSCSLTSREASEQQLLLVSSEYSLIICNKLRFYQTLSAHTEICCFGSVFWETSRYRQTCWCYSYYCVLKESSCLPSESRE